MTNESKAMTYKQLARAGIIRLDGHGFMINAVARTNPNSVEIIRDSGLVETWLLQDVSQDEEHFVKQAAATQKGTLGK